MKKNKKVCILSKPNNKEYGTKIIAYLESLGGKNISRLTGYGSSAAPICYYIDNYKYITTSGSVIPYGYEIISLDNCPIKEEQNNKLDLTQILKVGDPVYSVIVGNCIVSKIDNPSDYYPIILKPIHEKINIGENVLSHTKTGQSYNLEECECCIFPSKDQRDWSKFVNCTFKKGELIAVSLVSNPSVSEIYIRHFKEIKNNMYIIEIVQKSNELPKLAGSINCWNYAWKLSEIETILSKKEE